MWLYFVAVLRMVSVVVGYVRPATFATHVFAGAMRSDVSDLMGRTFGIWTSLSCTLCVLTARSPDPRSPIFLATFMSFLFAALYFAQEFFVFKTVTRRTVLSPAVVACSSMLWMGYLMHQ